MTESEAKKILKRDLRIQIKNGALPDGIEALTVAINALEEVQQYRAIGIVEGGGMKKWPILKKYGNS
jgi:hypothetical protein